MKCKARGCKNTANVKFCSQSCAARTNNKGVRRHGSSPHKICGQCAVRYKVTGRPSKFCSPSCAGGNRSDRIRNLWRKRLTEGYPYFLSSTHVVKEILIEKRGRKCNKCKRKTWNGKLIPLDLDHKDGRGNHNTWSNLRLLCPNCHAQTDTYKGANKGNGRPNRYQ